MKKTSLLNNSAIWLGAAISVSEIMSGAYIASVGLQWGLAAIVIGHLIGGLLFYLCGRIGAESGRTSMQCVAFSFGEQGSALFAGLNILQLIVWTAIRLHVSARALTALTGDVFPLWVWCLILGAVVILWIFLGDAKIGRINFIASALLLVLTFFMCRHVMTFRIAIAGTAGLPQLSFGAAIELSAAIPLAWIPLVADYTSKCERPKLGNAISTMTYLAGSIWMYVIGLLAALYCGHSDIIELLVRTGIVRIPLLIVALATITTTFLNACSAGISAQTISTRHSVRYAAILVLLAATILSVFVRLEQYDQFLYFIVAVFAPLGAILAADYFLLGKRKTKKSLDLGSMLLWAFGFVLYYLLRTVESPIGYTLPLVLLLALIRFLTERTGKGTAQ